MSKQDNSPGHDHISDKAVDGHAKIERNVAWLAILITVAVSFGGLAEIVPLMFQAETIKPLPGVKPYPALQLAGRDVYVREGCYNCHSQMIRTLRFESERYGQYSLAGESVYDRPFQWGSKRTGPDLARVGGRYSDEWHREHLKDPRSLVEESNMPSFPWLAENTIDGADLQNHMRALKRLGDPYTDAQIAAAPKDVAGKTELDAVVAYLQGLGKARALNRANEAHTPAAAAPAAAAPAAVAVPAAPVAPAAPAAGAP